LPPVEGFFSAALGGIFEMSGVRNARCEDWNANPNGLEFENERD
jgi:hypothetical protein